MNTDMIVFANASAAGHALRLAGLGGIDSILAAETLDDGAVRITGPADDIAALAAVDVNPVAVATSLLATAKAAAMVRVIAYANEITARITSRYPDAEVASWPTREAEARLIVAGGPTGDAPLLAAVAAATGDTVDNLAASVLAKAAAYRQVVAAVEAVRTQAEAAINACATPAEVDVALDALRQQAEALAAQMGLAA